MAPINRGQRLYSYIEKNLSKLWRESGKTQPFHQWKLHNRHHREALTHTFNTLIEPIHGEHGRPNENIPSNNQTEPHVDEPRRPDTDVSREGGPPAKRARNDSQEAGPSGVTGSNTSGAHTMSTVAAPMEVDQVSTEKGPNSGGGQGGHSLSTAGRGGGSSLVELGRSEESNTHYAEFSKSRICWAYAFAGAKINWKDGDIDKMDLHTTHLNLIPVDFLPFYLSPAEYGSLPEGSKVESVHCQVKILGVRSGFDVGATLSGVATSEYVPILHTAVGLNHEFHVKNYSYTTATSKPMVPTGVTEFNPKNVLNKWYYDANCQIMSIPRSASYFACIYQNQDADEATDYERFKGGYPRLDKIVKSYLLHSAIGEEIINYSYVPKAGFITMPKKQCIPVNRMGECTIPRPPHYTWTLNFVVNQAKTLEYLEYKPKDATAYNRSRNTSYAYNYSQTIEQYGVYSPITGPVGRNNTQPQVHIGMCAIPQLNPATEDSSFVNACFYYEVNCQIRISWNRHTMWGQDILANERELLMFTTQNKNYAQPDELLGFSDTKAGTLKDEVTVCDENIKKKEEELRKLIEQGRML